MTSPRAPPTPPIHTPFRVPGLVLLLSPAPSPLVTSPFPLPGHARAVDRGLRLVGPLTGVGVSVRCALTSRPSRRPLPVELRPPSWLRLLCEIGSRDRREQLRPQELCFPDTSGRLMASTSSVPVGFHCETKYVVLSYLGYPLQEAPREGPSGAGSAAKEEREKLKAEIEEELRRLEEEISAAFPSTGFDMHTSPVFSPASPDSTIEECLAQLADRMCLEIPAALDKASDNLLSGILTYDVFRKESDDVAAQTSGWNKVLVPLVLLQRLLLEQTRRGNRQLDNLVHLGVMYMEDVCADFIIQQGGWGTAFSLDTEEEDVPGLIAEDSNDIYILTSDNSEQVSPPESLAVSSSWHTESLPTSLGPESWQQVVMDPEELKSLDSNGGGEERSENNSSNSDIVHVEKEEIAEVIEEAAVVEERLEREEEEEEEEEDMEAEEREILVIPSATTTTLAAPSPPSQAEEKEIPPPPVSEPPKVDITITGAPEKKPPEEPKEDVSAPSPLELPEKLESPMSPLLPQSTEMGEKKPVFISEGKSILLYGGAAAVAILAVAVAMVMALRKK